MLNSTYKRGWKGTVPEKVNVYFEPMTIGLKSVKDKQTSHVDKKQAFSYFRQTGGGVTVHGLA
jgi:hypothetical protein